MLQGSSHQASVQEQELESDGGAVSSGLQSRRGTDVLTSTPKKNGKKQKKKRTQKQQGVKNSLLKGADPGSVTRPGKGRGVAKLFSRSKNRLHLICLPSSSESDDSNSSGGEDVEVDTQPSQPPLGSNPDQLTPQQVMAPSGTRRPARSMD